MVTVVRARFDVALCMDRAVPRRPGSQPAKERWRKNTIADHDLACRITVPSTARFRVAGKARPSRRGRPEGLACSAARSGQSVVSPHSLKLGIGDRADVLLLPLAERGEVMLHGLAVPLWRAVGPVIERLALTARQALHPCIPRPLQRVLYLLPARSVPG